MMRELHVLLRKPRSRYDAQLCLYSSEMLWRIRYDHHCFLYRTPCDVRRPIYQLTGV
jgi:hypothetical protein